MATCGSSTGGGARKRERENPCGICGHYHRYEEGEVCGICGHRMPATSERTSIPVSAFPSEILPDFLYLGSYDNASRSELLKTLGISRILNTVPSCTNLYKNSFTYYCLGDDKSYPFDEAIQYLEQCQTEKARVLVHCMTGKVRSPAIVIAYLMKCKGWRLAQSCQWVKERRATVEINQAVHELLVDYEKKIFGSDSNNSTLAPDFQPPTAPVFSFGFPKADATPAAPAFSTGTGTSMFDQAPPHDFTFGAGLKPHESPLVTTSPNPNGADVAMDGT